MTAAAGESVQRAGSLAGWVNLVVAIALLNGGNLLLDDVAKGAGISLDLFLSPGFVVAIGCLGLAFFFYVRSLARLPLAVAYPIMVGISMIVVAVANHFWGRSTLDAVQLAGVLTLFVGVVLISSSRPGR